MSSISKLVKTEENILLPDDVISNILLRTSIKDLFRFQCVCKLWRATISDPIFRQQHLELWKKNPRLLVIYVKSRRTSFWSLDKEGGRLKKFKSSDKRIENLDLLNTCLELVCLYDSGRICVYNPTTEELLTLPNRSSQPSGYMQRAVQVGMGYDPTTKQYKVIRVSKKSCDVFTIGSNQKRWRSAPNPPLAVQKNELFRLCGGGGCIYNKGFIHMYNQSYHEGILRFDVEQEKWSILPSPPSIEKYVCTLCQLNGFLCIVNEKRFDPHHTIDIWLLKDYDNNVWVKEYPNFVMGENLDMNGLLPLLTEDDGRILFEITPRLVQGRRYFYFDGHGGCKETQCRDMFIRRPLFCREGEFSTSMYVESFFSSGTGKIKKSRY